MTRITYERCVSCSPGERSIGGRSFEATDPGFGILKRKFVW